MPPTIQSSKRRICPTCPGIELTEDCFRSNRQVCVWCEWGDKAKRARYRYGDKRKAAIDRLRISKEEFVAWYLAQEDCCAYCGLTFDDLKRLQIRRGGGYCVAWDIDRIDSKRNYEAGNLALACFVCNMAKGDMLTAQEARIIGQTVKQIWAARLQ